MSRLTQYEKETIVNYNESEDTATVYTCSPSLIRKLKKLGYSIVSEDKASFTFKCPKRCISFRSPKKRQSKPMSEETKEKIKKARAERKNAK